MYIQRKLEDVLSSRLFGGKVLIVFGPRQAGKTTLVQHLTEPYGEEVRYIDCELPRYRDLLGRADMEALFSMIRGYKIVVFDEAQVVSNIGQILKSLFDHHPEVQYIATGSSSFDLANKVSEPLTGRSLEFTLYPMALDELSSNAFDAEARIAELMRFGGYPGVLNLSEEEHILQLKTLASQYVYKNIFAAGGIKKPEVITQLLNLLALQIGQEVSYRELAEQLGASSLTVERYIDLLEKNFIIFRLKGYAKNLRNEVTRTKKIYFIDLGLRNALIGNFAPVSATARSDVGALFENCMIVERLKAQSHSGAVLPERYFWRTTAQAEVDYIEIAPTDARMRAFEFKWNTKKRAIAPSAFRNAYPETPFTVVSVENGYAFISNGFYFEKRRDPLV